MTQVFSCSGNKGQSKIKPKWNISLKGGGSTSLASIYRPIYRDRGGWSGVFYGKEGWHWLLLVMGIQNTPHTYLPTLKKRSSKKVLKVIEPSEVKHELCQNWCQTFQTSLIWYFKLTTVGVELFFVFCTLHTSSQWVKMIIPNYSIMLSNIHICISLYGKCV